PVIVPSADRQILSENLHKESSKQVGNWLEEQLETIFTSWGIFVSRKPITVMILSLLICSIASLGLVLNFSVTTDPVDLWVSPSSEARRDMEDYNKHFGPFYRIEQIIITPTVQESFYHPIVNNHELKNISWGPVLQQDFLLAAFDLQMQIENLTARTDNYTIQLKDICLSPLRPLNSECAIQSLFGLFQNKREYFFNKTEYLEHFKRCALNTAKLYEYTTRYLVVGSKWVKQARAQKFSDFLHFNPGQCGVWDGKCYNRDENQSDATLYGTLRLSGSHGQLENTDNPKTPFY
ncbi:NPC intracellular cholesterol transporter 1, partial [Araneus ventricosus]